MPAGVALPDNGSGLRRGVKMKGRERREEKCEYVRSVSIGVEQKRGSQRFFQEGASYDQVSLIERNVEL